MGILLSILGILGSLCFAIYSIVDHFSTRKNATNTVVGRVTGAHCDSVILSALRDVTDESWWYISYTVNGKKYTIRKTAYGSEKKVNSCIGLSVVVHYDSSNPAKAWSEDPYKSTTLESTSSEPRNPDW